jgi:diguanylate cyclase (GGDEF)-like protein
MGFLIYGGDLGRLAPEDRFPLVPSGKPTGTFGSQAGYRMKGNYVTVAERRGAHREAVRVWCFTATLALTAIALAFTAVAGLDEPWAPRRLPWPLLAVGFALSAVMVMRFEFRGEAEALTLSEVPLLLGLVFTEPGKLLLAAVVGSAVGVVLYRRQAPTKAAFNVSVQALEAVVAMVCFHAVLGNAQGVENAQAVSARGWLAALVAALVADFVSTSCVTAAIALSAGWPSRSSLVPVFAASGVVGVINLTLGFVAVCATWASFWGLAMFVGISVVFGVGYRAFTSLRRRHADLEHLYGFSRALNGLIEIDEVVAAVLSEAKSLLRCEVAEVALYVPGGLVRYSLDRDDRLKQIRLSDANPLLALVDTASRAVLVTHGAGTSGLREALGLLDLRDAVVAPVPGDAGSLGTLIVANRLCEQATFDNADVKLLDALAAHSGVVLRNSQLLDRLRNEAAAKEYQALHDALTGLSNRTMFTERLEASLAHQTGGSVVAVMLMDLDSFKEVNDTLGHDIGDALLQQIASGLAQAIGIRGLVARLGGDEFAMVIPLAEGRSEVGAISREILAAAQRPVAIQGIVLEVRASLGVAIAPDQGSDTATLLRMADVAMYQAKASRNGVEIYDPNRDMYTTRRLLLVSDLHRALQTSSLELHYQPKAELASGQVTGVEALLRWTHSLYGVIPPDEFIPVAEHSGLIRPLTLWVLETALRQLAAWHRKGLHLTMAFNVSARSVVDTELVEDIDRLLSTTLMAPSDLTLELTESSLPASRSRSESVLTGLANLGVRLAIDDFGTGYSSLSRLKRLPVHEVKVDRSFVVNMVANHDDHAIVRSTIDLAHNLGLTVVAEGVEDEATWDRLNQLGCDTAQGYYVAQPLPAGVLESWLEERQARRNGALLGIRESA